MVLAKLRKRGRDGGGGKEIEMRVGRENERVCV